MRPDEGGTATLRPGPFGRSAIRTIERYRRWGRGRLRGGCRFEPTCSTFALEVFRTRAFPLALASSAWRIARCNPLVATGTGDPARRRRVRLRPNGPATVCTIAAITGPLLLIVTAVALAQGVNGGCTATVNGRDPATLTRDAPVVVQKGGTVRVRGAVPPAIQSLPEDQVQSNTTITVSIVEGVAEVGSSDHPGQGHAWGGTANVDEYVGGPVGLYFVEATAVGSPNWVCTASGYVKLEGNPLSEPIGQAATGVGLLGGAGALASTFSKRRPGDAAPSAQDVRDDFGKDVDQLIGGKRKKPSIWERDLKGNALVEAGCVFFLFGPLALEGPAAAAAAVALGRSSGRVWVRGHAVWGAISGLFLGIGIAVLGQQFALWPLTVITGIAFPVYTAVLGGVRAWIGRPYRRIAPDQPATSPTPPAPPSAPPAPPSPPPMPS